MSDEVTTQTREGVLDQPPVPRYDIVTSGPPAPDAAWLKQADDPNTDLPRLVGMLDISIGSVETAAMSVFFVGSRVLRYARSHEAEWKLFADDHSLGGDDVDAQVGDLILQRAPDYDDITDNLKRKRRSDNAHILGWFADHQIEDAAQVINEAAAAGRTEIIKLYAPVKKERADKARTAAATAKRRQQQEERKRQEEEAKQAEEARQRAEMEEIAEAHRQEEARQKAEKEAGLKRFVSHAPLPPPKIEPAPEQDGAPEGAEPTVDERGEQPAAEASELPTEGNEASELPADAAPPEGVSTDGVSADLPSQPEIIMPKTAERSEGSTDTEAESPEGGETEIEEEQQELTPLPDIENYLRGISGDPDRWELAAAIATLIGQENISPDKPGKPPLAVTLLAEIADPKTGKTKLYRIIGDREFCIRATRFLFDERREAGRLSDAAD